MPRILIGRDPYKEEGNLPWQEDYGKHYYGTLAMLKEGRHAGKVGVFSKTTVKSNEVPYFMFFPYLHENGFIEFVPETKVTYRSLLPSHPFPSGWWPTFTGNLIGVLHRQHKQWKVGLHANNTYLGMLSDRGLSQLQLGDRVCLESSASHCAIELAACFNTWGYPQYPTSIDESTSLFNEWDKKKPIILGKRTAAVCSLFYYLGVKYPVALVSDEGEIWTYNKAGERFMSSVVDAPIKPVSKTEFDKTVGCYLKGPKRRSLVLDVGPYPSASELPMPSQEPSVMRTHISEFFAFLGEEIV